MDWTTILTTLITMVVGGGLGGLFTLRTTRKRAEYELLNDQIQKEMARNAELIQINIDKENRFIEQTKRLRECQDREMNAMEQNIGLTRRIGELELVMERHKCVKERCPYKEPATDLTMKARAEIGLTPEPDDLPIEDPQPELTTKTI